MGIRHVIGVASLAAAVIAGSTGLAPGIPAQGAGRVPGAVRSDRGPFSLAAHVQPLDGDCVTAYPPRGYEYQQTYASCPACVLEGNVGVSEFEWEGYWCQEVATSNDVYLYVQGVICGRCSYQPSPAREYDPGWRPAS
jgi:hypothetical protein